MNQAGVLTTAVPGVEPELAVFELRAKAPWGGWAFSEPHWFGTNSQNNTVQKQDKSLAVQKRGVQSVCLIVPASAARAPFRGQAPGEAT